MASLEQYLRRWLAAGLLDAQTAERIREFERAERAEPGIERPGILEALTYLGIAVVGVGVVILVGENWDQLKPWARVLTTGVPGVLALVAGQALRSTGRPDLVRGGHIAWVVSTALVALACGIAADSADMDGQDVALLGTLVAAGVALGLWVLAPSIPQVLAMGGALFGVSMALGARTDDVVVAGVMMAVFGALGVLFAELDRFPPRIASRAVSSAGLGLGAFYAGVEGGPLEALAFVAGAVLIWLSISRGVLVYMLAGVAVIFAGLISTVLRHFGGSPTAAASSLIALGVLLVAVVLLLARLQPWEKKPT